MLNIKQYELSKYLQTYQKFTIHQQNLYLNTPIMNRNEKVQHFIS
jgi:hypothetical protein